MMRLKKLAADSFVYGASTLITRFISIFLIPIYTRIFSPNDYGIINLVNTTFILISILVVAGLDNAAARWYWDEEGEKESKITFSSWFWFQLAGSAFILIFVAFTSGFLSKTIIGSDTEGLLFLLAALNLPFTGIILLYTSWLRIRKQAVYTVIFSLVNSLVTIGLSVFLVVFKHQGLKGVFLAQLLSNFTCSLFVMVALRQIINLKHFNGTRIISMLRYSLPLVPAALAFWILNSAGAYFINYFASKSDVGLFQIGANIAAVCSMIFWAFLQAWTPFSMSIHRSSNSGSTYSLVFDIYCAIGSFIVLTIFLFAPEILFLFTTSQYVGAAGVAGILSVNVFISNIAQITSIGSAIKRTNRPFMQGVFVSCLLTLTLFGILIPFLGGVGAALSTLAGSSFLAFYVTLRSQTIHYLPYHFPRNILAISCMLLFSGMSFFLDNEYSVLTIAYKFALLLMFLAITTLIFRVRIVEISRKVIFKTPNSVSKGDRQSKKV